MPSVSDLFELFELCVETGVLVWKSRPAGHFTNGKQGAAHIAARFNSRFAGNPALSCVDSKGYKFGTIAGRPFRLHRVIAAMTFGEWPAEEVDHINGDRLDNRPENLRLASHQQNGKNAKRISRNTSGRTGVQWRRDRNRWQARIHVDGVTKSLGLYTSFDDACHARALAERRFGFHENHGRASA